MPASTHCRSASETTAAKIRMRTSGLSNCRRSRRSALSRRASSMLLGPTRRSCSAAFSEDRPRWARAESSAQLCNVTTPVGGIRSRISHWLLHLSTIPEQQQGGRRPRAGAARHSSPRSGRGFDTKDSNTIAFIPTRRCGFSLFQHFAVAYRPTMIVGIAPLTPPFRQLADDRSKIDHNTSNSRNRRRSRFDRRQTKG